VKEPVIGFSAELVLFRDSMMSVATEGDSVPNGNGVSLERMCGMMDCDIVKPKISASA